VADDDFKYTLSKPEGLLAHYWRGPRRGVDSSLIFF
jgi:hypothetical protein